LEKILISACFLGENVRYNGQTESLQHQILNQWLKQGRVVRVCPEVAGGLPVPRPAAEIDRINQRIITKQGEDVTDAFEHGAQKALSICLNNNIKFALLKESSPSCGSQTIYDGQFRGQKIAGQGATTKLLREHGIEVYSEENIQALITRIESS